MITIRGIHKVMGMKTEEGWEVTHISETPKDYLFKLIRERKVYNPNTFGIRIEEEETDVILSREGSYLMGRNGFKFEVNERGIHNIETFLQALNIVVKATNLIPQNP